MFEGLLDRRPFHPILLRNNMISQMLIHLAGLVLYTCYFHQLLHEVRKKLKRSVAKVEARSLALGIVFTESVS